MSIKLSTGREVWISHLEIRSIYLGVYEGTPEMVARYRRERLKERAGWFIVDAGGPVLPEYQCDAHLRSAKVGDNPDDFYSYLLVCWFTNNFNKSLAHQIRKALEGISWEEHATNCDDF